MAHKRRNSVFVHEGEIYEYPGSMREFQVSISQNQWEEAVRDTIDMFHFMTALKDTGVPALNEKWSRQDELSFRLIRRAVSDMKSIEPLLVARHNKEETITVMREKMIAGATETNKVVDQVKDDIISELGHIDNSYSTSQISGL